MPKVPRSASDLQIKLKQQHDFIYRSCWLYDNGYWDEAPRIATSVRVFLHDTRSSASLLGQLGVVNSLEFVNTALTQAMIDKSKAELAKEFGAEPGTLVVAGPIQAGLVMIGDVGFGPAFLPFLHGAAQHQKVKFGPWWTDKVIAHSQSTDRYSRRDVVTIMANQDGGAHVDPEIDATYMRLYNDNMGFWTAPLSPDGTFPEFVDPATMESAIGNLAHATVRQIGYELLLTIWEHWPDLRPAPQQAPADNAS
jgi:hypothetical protein